MNDVYRLHIRPTLEGRRIDTALGWCIENRVAGIGWPVDGDLVPQSPEEYAARVVETYGNRRPASIRFSQLQQGDFLWIRDDGGVFRLGRVSGPWRYAPQDSVAQAHGLFGLVDIDEWRKVGAGADVPGDVLRSYRPRSPALERLGGEGMRRWCEARIVDRDVGYSAREVVCELLTPTDVEDLVALWFQARYGLLLVPPSRARNDAAYDLELVGRPGGERVVVQVKTGDEDADEDGLPGLGVTGWVYAETGPPHDGTNRRLNAEDLVAFLRGERAWLPPRFRDWLGADDDASDGQVA